MTNQRAQSRWAAIVLAGFLIAVSFAGVVAAQERAAAREGARVAKGWWEREGVSEGLNLSAKQVSEIQVLESAKSELIKETRSTEFQTYRSLINAMEDGGTPAEELAQLRQTLEDAWLRHAQVTLDHLMELRKVLTAEQWHQLPEVAPASLRLGMLGVRRGKIDFNR